MTNRHELASIVRAWVEEGWRRGGATIVDRLHAADFIDHDPGGRPPGNDGFRQGIVDLLAAFPDLEARVEDLVVEPETGSVAVRWSAVGTHTGAYLGAPPTGRQVRFKGIEIVRFAGERITERWGEWDGLDLLVQLGRLGEATLPREA